MATLLAGLIAGGVGLLGVGLLEGQPILVASGTGLVISALFVSLLLSRTPPD
jgi:hypothetical protein